MKIAVVAWGSLVWDRRTLAVASNFKATGPFLPIEFSRISRDGRLTLVIDEAIGKSCATFTAMSTIADLDAAIENLRVREGMPNANGVGFVDLRTGQRSARATERHPKAVEAIALWAGSRGYDAAVWTALASNFQHADKANEPCSVEAAIRYLGTRDAQTLEAALSYIRRALPEVKTPIRTAVNARWPEG